MEPTEEILFDSGANREQRKLELLAGKHFKVTSVENTGYIVHNLNHPPNRDADWILIDIDDTIDALSLAKEERDEKVRVLLNLTEEQSELLSLTDQLSRFPGPDGQPESYHIKAHESLIALLKKGIKADKSAEEIRQELALHHRAWASGKDTFIADPEVQMIFRETTFKPRVYSETISALKKLSDEQSFSVHAPNIAFFTYGEADYQLYKALQLAEACGINSIWLTKKQKGDFLKKLLAQDPGPYSKIEARVSAQDLRMVAGEDISDDVAVIGKDMSAYGIDFNSSPRILMLFDDSPDELKSLKQEFPEGSAIIPIGIRVKRRGTKNYEKDVEIDGIELPVETIPSPIVETAAVERLPTSFDIKVAYATEAVRRYRDKKNPSEESKYDSAANFLESKGYSVDKILES